MSLRGSRHLQSEPQLLLPLFYRNLEHGVGARSHDKRDGGKGFGAAISRAQSRRSVRRNSRVHAGGKIPYTVPQQSGVGGNVVFTVVYQDFGVRLRFAPTVLANGLINMDLNPEVSDIDPALSVPVGGGDCSGISVRTARTTIELRDGQSFAMAGLLQNINERDIDQLPWLGSLPVIGTLFRSTGFRQRETELVVIVTPHLVRPTKPGDVSHTSRRDTAGERRRPLHRRPIGDPEKARRVCPHQRCGAWTIWAHPEGASSVPVVRTGVKQ